MQTREERHRSYLAYIRIEFKRGTRECKRMAENKRAYILNEKFENKRQKGSQNTTK